jgi:hypothetical protein
MVMTPNDFHVDQYLTNFISGYDNRDYTMVARTAFTVVPVEHKSDIYLKIDKGAWFRDEMAVRAMGGASRLATFSTSTGTYNAQEWALRHMVDDRVRANNNSPLIYDESAAAFLERRNVIRQDRYFAANYFKTGVWGVDLTGVSSGPSTGQFLQWDQSGSDPAVDLAVASETMSLTTGFKPNTLVLGSTAFTRLSYNASLLAKLPNNSVRMLDEAKIAQLFGIPNVVVATGIYNSAGAGQADSLARIFNSKAALLLYKSPTATLDGTTPTAGAIFAWDGLIPGSGNGQGSQMLRRRAEREHSDEFEIRAAWDQATVATDMGTFFTSAVA